MKRIIIAVLFSIILYAFPVISFAEGYVPLEDIKLNLFEQHIKLADFNSSNWGLLDSNSDFWSGKYYTIYTDGKVECYDLYNKRGKVNEVSKSISYQNLLLVNEILRDNINLPSDTSAADGTGWHFTYYNTDGSTIGEYVGYIYSNKQFNELIKIVENDSSESQSITAILNKDIMIKYNNTIQKFKDASNNEVFPISYNGTTYLPVRAISSLLGIKVEWEASSNSILLAEGGTYGEFLEENNNFTKRGTNEINVVLNKTIKTYYNDLYQVFKDVNGNIVYPLSYGGTTYLPVRALSKLFNLNIEWQLQENTVAIEKKVEFVDDIIITEPTSVYAILYSDGELVLNRNCNVDKSRNVLHKTDDITNGLILKIENKRNTSNLTTELSILKENISKITIEEKIAPKSMENWFYGLSSVSNINNIDKINTSFTTNFSNTFAGCSRLSQLDLSNFDTSNAITLDSMFMGCSSITKLNLSNFNTKKVNDIKNCFYKCTSLKELNISNFDTGNIESFENMFSGCLSLEELDISHFNTSKCTNMANMFHTVGTTNLDVSKFDTKLVEDMSGMFSNSHITYLNLSNFDTSNVKNMSKMFEYCRQLNKIDVSKFNTIKVEDMSYMFYECNSLEEIAVDNWNVSNVMNMRYMFNHCNSLKQLDLSKWDASNVEDFSWFLNDAYKLENLNLSGFKMRKAKNISNMFDSCTNLKEIDLSGFDTSNVISMESMFSYCSKLEKIDISSFNTSNVVKMYGLFRGCSGLKSLDVSKLDTSKVDNMMFMFSYITVEELDLSNFNTSQVKSMREMFYGCKNLKKLNLSSFDTSNLKDPLALMSTFEGCSSLSELDLTSFDTSNCDCFQEMFSGCTNLKNIYVSEKWSIEKAKDKQSYGINNMFDNCGTDHVTISK